MKKILANAWDIIRTPSNKNSQVALAIAVIVVSSVAGLFCAFLFGVASRNHGFGYRVAGGLVAVLSCIGAFSVGGMLGLLFGSPSWGGAGQAGTINVGPNETDKPSASAHASGIRPNTSLERISDWLTTMIVGLSLVHLKDIEERGTNLAVWLTRAISGDPNTVNGSVGIVIVISYSFAGFLLVYLWAMRFLPSELRSSFEEISERVDAVVEEYAVLKQAMQGAMAMETFRKQPVFAVPDHALQKLDAQLSADAIDEVTRGDILSRYRAAKTAEDEPMKDFGKPSDSGYQLAAEVKETGPGYFSLKVVLTGPSPPTAAKVYWLMHNSFSPSVGFDCPITAAGATYETTVNEAFWLGAVIPVSGGPAIRLGLWLGDAVGATPAFRPENS